jgi:hypothetical protein
VVAALRPGMCVVCLQPYAVGDQVGLLSEGWAHIDCWDMVLGGVDD